MPAGAGAHALPRHAPIRDRLCDVRPGFIGVHAALERARQWHEHGAKDDLLKDVTQAQRRYGLCTGFLPNVHCAHTSL